MKAKDTLRIETDAVITGGPKSRILRDATLIIRSGKIEEIETKQPKGAKTKNRTVRMKGRVAIPGFVQTHIHLCQTNARGTADDRHLMDWLVEKIFPYEDALTEESLSRSVRRGLAEVLLTGTTCIMDMGTVRHTDVIAQELLKSGIRAYFGKCLMDVNPHHPRLKDQRSSAISESIRLAKDWHEKDGRLRYAFTPRFILSCSDDLMKEAHDLLMDFPGTRYHTHASENPHEIEAVRARCKMDNVEYLDRIGVLTEKTVLAHCVHVNQREVDILKRRRVNVAHCPSSNLKLASGIADIGTFLKEGIRVSLGSDGAACNNRLDQWTEMRLAALLQKPKHGATAVDAKTAFLMATWEGARALGWEDEIGSLEKGKAADIVFVDMKKPWMPETLAGDVDYYSALVYSGRPENVTDVLIQGEWIVKDRELTNHLSKVARA